MAEYGKGSIAGRLCGRFPVHFVCLNGDSTALSQLLSSGKFDLYEEDCFRGWTPAHYAAECGQLDCLMQLQGVGVNLNVATQQQHETPLHVAAEAGHSACLTLLLQQGVSIDIQDIHGETAAHKAARHGHVECLQLLRTQGGCFKFPFSVCNYEGKTAGELYQPMGQSEMVCDATTDVQPSNQHSRKRGQMNEEPSTVKRIKFDASETAIAAEPALPSSDVPASVQDYPMDFNEETVPREYTRPSLMTSGGTCLPMLPNSFDCLPRSDPHPKWKCQPFVI